uniref:Uncharacterized protein n=1 Tax=Lepeophtheirus salmonis TaxID=72036 RepID=A0A0K2TYP1_LEPSM
MVNGRFEKNPEEYLTFAEVAKGLSKSKRCTQSLIIPQEVSSSKLVKTLPWIRQQDSEPFPISNKYFPWL